MKLICAGLPKTGTKSLAAALRHLGYTVYDADEHWFYHNVVYADAFSTGKLPNFKEMYQSVDAVTDLPPCLFFEEIFRAFPGAKVVLGVRDNEETWARSIDKSNTEIKSLFYRWSLILPRYLTPTGRKFDRLFALLVHKVHDSMKYTEHNDRVRATIPAHQLLVLNTKDGWEPLCKFLGKDIPDIPFPRMNVNRAGIPDLLNNSRVVKQMKKEFSFILAAVLPFLAVLMAALWY